VCRPVYGVAHPTPAASAAGLKVRLPQLFRFIGLPVRDAQTSASPDADALVAQVEQIRGQRRDDLDVPPAPGLGRVANLARDEHPIDFQRASGARELEEVAPADRQGLLGAQSGRTQQAPQHPIGVGR